MKFEWSGRNLKDVIILWTLPSTNQLKKAVIEVLRLDNIIALIHIYNNKLSFSRRVTVWMHAFSRKSIALIAKDDIWRSTYHLLLTMLKMLIETDNDFLLSIVLASLIDLFYLMEISQRLKGNYWGPYYNSMHLLPNICFFFQWGKKRRRKLTYMIF